MNQQQLISFLREVPLLDALEDNEFEDLSGVSVIRDFDKGKIIFYEQDKGTSLYIIVSGTVKLSIIANDGREHILGFLKDKEFFGEISLLDGESRSTSAISVDKVKVITVSRENFLKILKNNPQITYKIILSLCTKIRWTDRHVSNLAFLSASGKVARTIYQMAEDVDINKKTPIVINHKMTRQDFANIAGTSRETLTRIMLDFQDEGIISSGKNELIIYDKNRLKEKII